MARPVSPDSMRQYKPWVRLQISRATWFRYVKLWGHRRAWENAQGWMKDGMKYGKHRTNLSKRQG